MTVATAKGSLAWANLSRILMKSREFKGRRSKLSPDIYALEYGSPFIVSSAHQIMSASDYNAHTIAEFRKNHGKVGGYFEGAPILLLHTTGAKTSKLHVVPVMYLAEGKRYVVFASKGGADSNPDWYHNLKAHPQVKAEIGDDIVDLRAEEVVGPEHDSLYARQVKLYPQFGEYQRKTKRKIPVIALTGK